jgi:hypothetical protein
MVSFQPRSLFPGEKVAGTQWTGRVCGPPCWYGPRGEEKILDPTGTRTPTPRLSSPFFFFLHIGGGVHTGSTRHCGHSWTIVPAPGDCEDGDVGGMNGFGRGNRSTRRKPAPTPLCPPQIPLARPRRETGPPLWFVQPLASRYTDCAFPAPAVLHVLRRIVPN